MTVRELKEALTNLGLDWDDAEVRFHPEGGGAFAVAGGISSIVNRTDKVVLLADISLTDVGGF